MGKQKDGYDIPVLSLEDMCLQIAAEEDKARFARHLMSAKQAFNFDQYLNEQVVSVKNELDIFVTA